MDFPLGLFPTKIDQDDGILVSLGITSEVQFYGKSGTKILIEVSDDSAVMNLNPDYFNLLKQDGFGVIVTALGHGEFDFISRFFHPWAGVNEDPVTGSAHCILATYFKDRLKKQKMLGLQASSRGGVVAVEILNSERVNLIGRGVIVVRGNI